MWLLFDGDANDRGAVVVVRAVQRQHDACAIFGIPARVSQCVPGVRRGELVFRRPRLVEPIAAVVRLPILWVTEHGD